MEGCLVLKDCAVVLSDGRIRSGLAVRIEGDTILDVAPNDQVPIRPGDWEVRCEGRVVAPGWVDCHSHLVNGQLLPPSLELFLQPSRARFDLQQLRDVTLTPGEVEALAGAAIAQSLRRGVTLVAEHLHCPAAPAEALEVFARTSERLGIQALVSHATTDSDGEQQARAQAEANAEFVRRHASGTRVRGAMGFHASFTCGEALLSQIGSLREALDRHVLFHASETEHDLAETYERHGARPVARFEKHGLLGRWSIATGARAVDRDESERLARAGALIALSPRADALSEPGGSGFDALLARQQVVGLGSSGVGALCDQVASAASAVVRLARVGRLIDPDNTLVQMMMGGPSELRSALFRKPSGVIEPGAHADLVVFDWIPPVSSAPLPDIALSWAGAQVAWTIVGGRVVVREGQLLGHDERELAREAAKVLALRAKA